MAFDPVISTLIMKNQTLHWSFFYENGIEEDVINFFFSLEGPKKRCMEDQLQSIF